MSILIKGMEMPTIPQTVIIYPDGTVADVYNGKKYKAIPVPDHGDLIDREGYRDEFMNGVYELCADDPDNYRANSIIDLFDDAPTIIQASKEEDK